MTKSKNTSKTRQKLDFGMEPKITTLVATLNVKTTLNVKKFYTKGKFLH